MRVVGLWSAIGAVVIGLIIADLATHPKGTNAIASGITNLEKNSGNQLHGSPAK